MLEKITSREALYAAFERVRDNAGCRGVDGVTVGDFAGDLENQLDRLQRSLHRRTYHPLPLLRLTVNKREGGHRYLAVPIVRDRVLQTAVYLATQELFEAEFETVSHAFRPGRSVRSAVHRIAELRDEGYRFVVDADIEDFFGSIPQERLLARLRRLKLDAYLLSARSGRRRGGALFRRPRRAGAGAFRVCDPQPPAAPGPAERAPLLRLRPGGQRAAFPARRDRLRPLLRLLPSAGLRPAVARPRPPGGVSAGSDRPVQHLASEPRRARPGGLRDHARALLEGEVYEGFRLPC